MAFAYGFLCGSLLNNNFINKRKKHEMNKKLLGPHIILAGKRGYASIFIIDMEN